MSSPLYLIYGEDEYLVSSKLKELLDQLVPESERDLGLESIDGSAEKIDTALVSMGSCLEALNTIGFFGNSKVILWRDVNYLHDNRTGKSEAVKERLDDIATIIKGGLPDGVTLVITSPKVDKRRSFYKACNGVGEVFEFALSDKAYQAEKQAKENVKTLLKQAGIKMPQQVQHVFLSRVGTRTRQLAGEIEKLAVYLGDRKEVEKADVDAITSSCREAVSWDLDDAFGKRDVAEALKVLRTLMFQNKKESTIRLVMGLSGRIKDLMIYREAIDKGWLRVSGSGDYVKAQWMNMPSEIDAVFSDHYKKDPRATHPFRAGLLAGQAKRFTLAELKSCQRAVLAAHHKLVTSSVPGELTLELLLVRMLSGKPASR